MTSKESDQMKWKKKNKRAANRMRAGVVCYFFKCFLRKRSKSNRAILFLLMVFG